MARWSKKDEASLVKIFERNSKAQDPIVPLMVDKTLPNRTLHEKCNKARYMGLMRPQGIKWREFEHKVLQTYYPVMGSRFCAELLPYRTANAIRNRAGILGLSRNPMHLRVQYKNKALWHKHEDQILIAYGNKTADEISRLLPRKGPHSVNRRRKYLQTKLLGCPEIWIQPANKVNINALSNESYQILLGSVLGHHDIGEFSVNAGFHGIVSKQYRDFTRWTGDRLKAFVPHIDIKSYPIMESYARVPIENLTALFNIDSLAEGKIPFDHIKRMDETGLLIWYLNRGSSNRIKCAAGYNSYPTLTTNNYQHDQVEEVTEFFNKKMGFGMKPYFGTKNTPPTNRIHLYSKARNKLSGKWNVMANTLNIPKCINRKLPTLNMKAVNNAPKWWSAGEENVILNNWGETIETLMTLLPSRDKMSIIAKLDRMDETKMLGARAMNR